MRCQAVHVYKAIEKLPRPLFLFPFSLQASVCARHLTIFCIRKIASKTEASRYCERSWPFPMYLVGLGLPSHNCATAGSPCGRERLRCHCGRKEFELMRAFVRRQRPKGGPWNQIRYMAMTLSTTDTVFDYIDPECAPDDIGTLGTPRPSHSPGDSRDKRNPKK